MNYPDLETCKAIAGEFPESEFGWIRNTVYYRQLSVRKRDYDGGPHDEIFAPAPTCEELGEWLHSKNMELFLNWGGEPDEIWFLAYEGDNYREGWYSDSHRETQARAEAVKLILESTNDSNIKI